MVFAGGPWGNIGYVKVCEELGKDAKPVIASMKRLLAAVERQPELKERLGKSERLQKAVESAAKAIQDYEEKYGVVEP